MKLREVIRIYRELRGVLAFPQIYSIPLNGPINLIRAWRTTYNIKSLNGNGLTILCIATRILEEAG